MKRRKNKGARAAAGELNDSDDKGTNAGAAPGSGESESASSTVFVFGEAPGGPTGPTVVQDDDDDDEEQTIFVMEDVVSAPASPPPLEDDDEDEDKTVFALEDAAPLSPSIAVVAEPAPQVQVVPHVDEVVPAVAEVTPSMVAAVEDDDEDEDKTVFAMDDATAAPPVPPPLAVDDEEDEDKTVFAMDDAAPAPAPMTAADAPSPAPASEPLASIIIDASDDEDEESTVALSVDSDFTPDAEASPVHQAPVVNEDATIIFTGDDPAPAKADKAPAKADKAPVHESTGTGHSVISTWGTGHSTGSTGGTGPTASSAAGQAKPEPGAVIAQYELIRLLGEGGMGAVYLARDVRLGRRVAIKFLHTTNAELAERFVIEARATARVEHENIVSIYEVGEWGGSPYMVLQFLQGNELTKLIPRGGKTMPVPRVVELMTPVLRALDCAHNESIVHRDLKPDNIFITDAGVTKVLDFGIAKVVQGDDATSDGEGTVTAEELKSSATNTSLTRHGSIMGTMPYMSPEQWGNGVAIDHTTDIWAVGIMMFKMLSGRHPLYPMKGHELMVTGFIDEPMPSLREKAPDLPEELCKVIDKCLTKDKSKRWPNALALLRALEPFQPGRYSVGKTINIEESPYAGLSSFQEEDAGRFYGRNREIAAMSQRLRECPMMAVVGPSGVGKSSFVRAGVVPALKNSGESWDISVVRPGRSPLMALAGLLMHVTQESGAATSMNIGDEVEQQKKKAERLREEPGYLGTVLRRHARKTKKKLLLFVDQFEELYTLVEEIEERLAFTACLAAAADDQTSPMRVVVSIRSDFLDRCVEDVHFMTELSKGLFFMTSPTRDGMRDSLVLPAEMAGYKFESEAILTDMLDHLAQTSGGLPLLQFTADKLWSERDPARKLLTQASYDALGGIGGALASHAGQVLKQVSSEHQKLVRALFLRLVTPERTRAIVPMDDLREQLGDPADVQRLIDQMVQARLLVVQSGGGGSGATVELVHESLIHGWPQLRRWLDEGQEDAAFLEQLRNTSRQWQAKKRDSGLLWRGEMAEEAKRFVRRYRGQLPDTQKHFLEAVIALSTRAARIRRVLLVAASVVVALLLTAAAVALYVINEAAKETELQAVAARAAEVRATEAAAEAEKRKVQAEAALAEAEASAIAREAAREAERKALAEANLSREQLAEALVDAQSAEKRAVSAAAEASRAKGVAEARAQEAIAARLQATQANANLQVALKEVEQKRNEAMRLKAESDRQKEAALKRLEELTRGGIVEVLR